MTPPATPSRRAGRRELSLPARAHCASTPGAIGCEFIHWAAIEVDYQIYRQSDPPTLGTLDRQAEPADKKAMLVAVADAQYDVALG